MEKKGVGSRVNINTRDPEWRTLETRGNEHPNSISPFQERPEGSLNRSGAGIKGGGHNLGNVMIGVRSHVLKTLRRSKSRPQRCRFVHSSWYFEGKNLVDGMVHCKHPSVKGILFYYYQDTYTSFYTTGLAYSFPSPCHLFMPKSFQYFYMFEIAILSIPPLSLAIESVPSKAVRARMNWDCYRA